MSMYADLEFDIGFQIGKAVFQVNSHRKLFKMMKVKKVKEIEAVVNYPDLGMCITKFLVIGDGLYMAGRTQIK